VKRGGGTHLVLEPIAVLRHFRKPVALLLELPAARAKKEAVSGVALRTFTRVADLRGGLPAASRVRACPTLTLSRRPNRRRGGAGDRADEVTIRTIDPCPVPPGTCTPTVAPPSPAARAVAHPRLRVRAYGHTVSLQSSRTHGALTWVPSVCSMYACMRHCALYAPYCTRR
jgi:hypothetical protein